MPHHPHLPAAGFCSGSAPSPASVEPSAIAQLTLSRDPDDGRLYRLSGGTGSLRLRGHNSRFGATARAGGDDWQLVHRGVLTHVIQAKDSAGATPGHFEPWQLRSAGYLDWCERVLELRRQGVFGRTYALTDHGRRLAVIDGRGWRKRPLDVTVVDLATMDLGLLLFAIFVAQSLTENAGAGC
jgi:hypothetical protein